jgi:hypothetical protein
MNLSQEQQEKIRQAVREKWGEPPPPCSMCGSRSWEIAGQIFELREFQQGALVAGGAQTLYPVVPILCGNCGNTIFLNAIKAGLLSHNPVPEQEGT